MTDGDIRRGTLEGYDINSKISDICNKDFKYGTNLDSKIYNQKILKSLDSFFLPILNEKGELIDVLIDEIENTKKIDSSVLILAGGFGKRMGSLTSNTPKPLIEVHGKALIEHTLENLSLNGFDQVIISTFYQSKKIIEKIGDGRNYGLNIEYIVENEPLGTFGSIKLVKDDFNNLLLINSDVLTQLNLSKIVKFLIKNSNKITLGVISYFLNVPFGVLDFNDEIC